VDVVNARRLVTLDSAGGLGGYIGKLLATGPVCYWPMSESGGSVALDVAGGANGTYTGVTLGQTGIGDGLTCPYFDGVNDFLTLPHAAVTAALADVDLMSWAMWFRTVDTAVWHDGVGRVMVEGDLGGGTASGMNQRATVNPGAHSMYYRWDGPGQQPIQDGQTVGDTTVWVHVAMTWDQDGDSFKTYYNGVEVGPVAAITNGNTAMSALVVGSGYTSPPANPWLGWLAHLALWDGALSAEAIAALAVVP